jgi:hypothetical protein
MAISAEQQRKVIERTHHTLQFDAIDQKDRYGNFVLAYVVKEYVLHILCLLAGHQLDPFFLFWAAIGRPAYAFLRPASADQPTQASRIISTKSLQFTQLKA